MQNNDRSGENPNRFGFNWEEQLGADVNPEDIQRVMQAGLNLGFGIANNFLGAMFNPQGAPQPNTNAAPNQNTTNGSSNNERAPLDGEAIYQQARTAYEQSKFDQAHQVINPLIEQLATINNKNFAASVYALYGAIQNKMGNFAAALQAHHKSVAICRSINDEKNILQCLFNINNVALEQAKQCFTPQEAKEKFVKVITVATQHLNNPKVVGKLAAGFHLQAAVALTYLGRSEQAEEHYLDALLDAEDLPGVKKIITEKYSDAKNIVEARKGDRSPKWREFFIAQQGTTTPSETEQITASDDELLDNVLAELEGEQNTATLK